MKKGFLLYHEYAEHFDLLTNEEIGQLMRAIFAYEISGEILPLAGAAKMAFSFIRADLDQNREKYKERCSRNADNGKKGGRPRKNDGFSENQPEKEETQENQTVSEQTERFSEKPKKADSDIDSDIDSDKEKNIKKEPPHKK